MCGICGYITSSPLPRGLTLDALCRTMTDTLAHRGPDGSGVWVDEAAGIAMGHRRLAIIDLSPAGTQPMESHNGHLILTYNGEIYNFPELRRELQSHGYVFSSDSDTEVLLAAIAQWGVRNAVKRCIGMFAFALWDKQDRSLTLVRDRLGIKPLYYGHVGESLIFASELKPFHKFPGFTAEVDRNVLASYFRFATVPAPHAIFRGVHKLRPGEIVTFKDGQEPQHENYWSMRETAEAGYAAPFAGTLGDAVSTLENLLHDAVGKRMVSDVPLGAFLSGGIDSSLVTALMQAQSRQPVRTFSIGFGEHKYDEAPYAKAVARHLGCDHTELYVDSAMLIDIVPDIPHHWDEPFADSSQIPTHILSKLTKEHVTVCLSGDGGDELFLGYDRYGITASMWDKIRLVPLPLRTSFAKLIKHIPSVLTKQLGKRAQTYFWRLDGLASTGFQEFYRFILSSHHAPASLVIGSREVQTNHLMPMAPLDEDNHLLMALLDTTNYLPDDILTKVDRASMAVGLEARVPLLDHRVVEFASSLPTAMKLGHLGKKTVLKSLLAKHVPQNLIDRPKAGFTIPIELWLGNELRDWCEDLLDEKSIREAGYLEPSMVTRMWQEYLTGRTSWHSCLWSVLMFQSWLRKWK